MKVHVLCSGGMDSATLAFHYRSLGHDLALHWIDYGHESRAMEWIAARWVSGAIGAPLHSHTATDLVPSGGEVLGRNRRFVETIAPHVGVPALVALGIHSGCEYEDTKPPFVVQMQRWLDARFGGLVQMDCPFLHMTKAEIAEVAEALAVPVEQTYSCDLAGPAPCGQCRSCVERNEALWRRGLSLLL